MDKASGERPNWGARLAGLGLLGGFLGWGVICAGLIAMLRGAYSIIGPVSFEQATAEFLRQGMAAGAFVLGAPIGAGLGLITGVAWRLACRSSGRR